MMARTVDYVVVWDGRGSVTGRPDDARFACQWGTSSVYGMGAHAVTRPTRSARLTLPAPSARGVCVECQEPLRGAAARADRRRCPVCVLEAHDRRAALRRRIQQLHAAGRSRLEICQQLRVSPTTVRRVTRADATEG